MCEVCEVMRRHEEYARGWVRLYPNSPDAKEMADYALKLMRLRAEHAKRCQ